MLGSVAAAGDSWAEDGHLRDGLWRREQRADSEMHGLVYCSRSVTTRWSSSELPVFRFSSSLYIRSDIGSGQAMLTRSLHAPKA